MNSLVDYIQNCLSAGLPRETIYANLLNTGWKKQDVDQAFAGITIPSVPPVETLMASPSPDEPQTVGYMPVAAPVQNLQTTKAGKAQAWIGIICAVISLLFLPPLFGIAGIVLGVVALNKGQKTMGLVTIILAAVFMVIGMVLSFIVNSGTLSEAPNFIFYNFLQIF